MFCIGGAVSACSDKEEKEKTPAPELTIFIHQPYSGLETYLDRDLTEVNNALLNNPELCQKINILYFRNNDLSGKLYKKVYQKDKKSGLAAIQDVLQKEYTLSQIDYTSFSGLKQILSDVVSIGKTSKYGMIIGCHADGWLPTKEDKSSRAFGYPSIDRYATSYKTLAKAIEATGKQFEFILIDDCYSQNIEVAYDLRKACRYLIGSVTEIGADGQQYETTIPSLYAGNYKAICDNTLAYYTNPGNPFGTTTMSVIDCSKTEQMASLMKTINQRCSSLSVNRNDIQVLDGYDYTFHHYNIFYDFADYVHNLCKEANLIADFENLMNQLVVYNVYTPEFNSQFFCGVFFDGKPYLRPIRTCCGITCSDPCTEKQSQLQQTSWYIATH